MIKHGCECVLALRLSMTGAALSAQVTAIDGAGRVGQFSSLAIGSDGLPLISYWYDAGASVSHLKVAHCGDLACTAAPTITTLDTDNGGVYTSVAVGVDGLALISYLRSTTNLKVAHCEDVACTTATLTALDTGWFSMTDLAIGADGLGLIGYFDYANNDLKVAHCSNTACTSATITTLDPSPARGWYVSSAIGSDGLGLVAYTSGDFGGPGGDVVLKVAHCNNTTCTTATISTVDSVSQVGEYVGSDTALVIGADGRGLVSYNYQKTGSPQQLRVAHCSNAACTTAQVSTLETAPGTGHQTSITVGRDGFALISYLFQGGNRDLKLARCSNLECSAATFNILDGPDSVGLFSSIAIGSDDAPIVSYYDETNADLKVAHCLDRFCGAPAPGLSFFTLTPCRLVDTRSPDGPLAGPALVAKADRAFSLASVCGIPATAKALSVNLTVTGPTMSGNARLHPAGTAPPFTSSVNYASGQTRANNAVVGPNALGQLAVYCAQASGSTHFLDVNGYFE